jgi:hypothetical protein
MQMRSFATSAGPPMMPELLALSDRPAACMKHPESPHQLSWVTVHSTERWLMV